MKPVLVACEYSATVRDALRATGIDAWSNDILDTEGDPRWHIKGDMRDAIRMRQWALVIVHIECTAMTVAGNSTYGYGCPKYQKRIEAIVGAMEIWELAKLHADCVAMENPVSVLFPYLKQRGADVQYVQPWQFGHPEQKCTGFALHRLPRLTGTRNVYNIMMALPRHQRERIHFMSPGPRRGLERSRFLPGMAQAIAHQWGVWTAL